MSPEQVLFGLAMTRVMQTNAEARRLAMADRAELPPLRSRAVAVVGALVMERNMVRPLT